MESGLEIEQDTDGFITEVSSDRCFVSIDQDGTASSLSFGRSFLYTFGQQCEGDMTNILEEGMEVNVSYKYSPTQDKVSVIAVWVGEKPDFASRHAEPLDDVYNQKGIVDKIHEDGSFIVRADGMDFNVVVRLGVVYRDGFLLKTDQCPVIVGDMVTFDAVPSGAEPPEAAYLATCSWIGREPRLADRFQLSILNSNAQDLETLTKYSVYGIVIVIPNNAVAFVRVEGCGKKVVLFRSSFSQISERIDDVVKVGDSVCMRLSFGCIFHGCRQWFAAAACMDGEDISEVNRGRVTELRESVSSSSKIDYLSSPAMSEDDSKSFESASESGLLSEEIANAKAEDSIDLSSDGSSAAYEGSGGLLYNKSPLTGILRVITSKSGIITYGEHNILVRRKCFFGKEGLITKKQFQSMRNDKRLVKFEAYPYSELAMNTHITHKALYVWIDNKPALSLVALNLLKGNYFLPKDNTLEGRVIGFYLPEVAFLATGKATAPLVFCQHIKDLGEEYQPRKCLISDFVKIGDFVKFKIRQNKKFPLGMCAYGIEKSTEEAFNTFLLTLKLNPSLKKILKKPKAAREDMDGSTNYMSYKTPEGMLIKDEDSHVESWDSVWGSGEYFKVGEVEVVHGNYVVKFVSSKVPNTETRLDLSTALKTKQLYCDEKRVNVSPNIKVSSRGKPKSNIAQCSLEGRDITFHVGRTISGAEVIKCAWIGECPEMPMLLGGKTEGFRGLICNKWCYEGVIEEFPLPTHAICKVGALHVHLPLTQITRKGEMVGVVESHLKKGDTVLLKITTRHFPNTKITCLTSSFCTSVKKVYDDRDVLKVVKGTIVDLPNPLGKIKMLGGSIEAKFDRSAVLAVNSYYRHSRIIYVWDKIVSKSMVVGAVVYFSAAKDLTLQSYRAYEVWIGKSPFK